MDALNSSVPWFEIATSVQRPQRLRREKLKIGPTTQTDYLMTLAVITRIRAVSLNPAVPTITFSPSRIFTSL